MRDFLTNYVLLKGKTEGGSKRYLLARLDMDSCIAEPCDELISQCVGWSLRELRERLGWTAVHRWQTAHQTSDSQGHV